MQGACQNRACKVRAMSVCSKNHAGIELAGGARSRPECVGMTFARVCYGTSHAIARAMPAVSV